MPTTYIPRPDGDFEAWQRHFAKILSENFPFWPIDGTMVGRFFDASAAWSTAYAASVAAKAAAEAATQVKEAARAQTEAALRPLVRQLQALAEVTNADRRNLGITVRSGSQHPGKAPTSAPKALVLPGGRLTHVLRLTNPDTPKRRTKPRGTLGAEVWVALVPHDAPAPQSLEAYRYLALSTRATLRAEFEAKDKGKLAIYLTRWLGTTGETGPWSHPTPATVAA